MAITAAQLKRFVRGEIRSRGVTATTPGLSELVKIAQEAKDENKQTVLEELLDAVIKEELPNGVVDDEVVRKVAMTMKGEDSGDPGSNTVIISAFDVPQYKFNSPKRVFQEVNGEQERLAKAQAKTEVLRERYLLIQQRLLRHKSFTKPFAVTKSAAEEYYQLARVESLKTGGRGVRYVLGMIGQPDPGKFTLEDLSGSIDIDISKAEATVGFFTENSIVLAVGQMENGVFHLSMVGLPPPEPRSTTQEIIGKMDFFGHASKTLDASQLMAMEAEAEEAMFIILSEVHLDKTQVLNKLEILFAAFEDQVVPTLFVLAGSFTSRPVGQGGETVESYASYFGQLANLICKFPNIANNSHFVLVPGANDPGVGNTWPRPGITSLFVQHFASIMPEGSFTFTSNPCRIRYYSQEIVLGRYNFMHEMRRHCVLEPSDESESMVYHLAKTLLAQSHLCPLPFTSRPVLWDYDSALRLYPCPDLAVLCDQHEMYTQECDGSQVANPGPFHTDFSFIMYYPSRWRSDDAEIRAQACETSVIEM